MFRKVVERITGESKRKIIDMEFELEKLRVLYEKEKEEMQVLGRNELENIKNLHDKVKFSNKKILIFSGITKFTSENYRFPKGKGVFIKNQ